MALPEMVNMVITYSYDPHLVKEDLILMNPDMEITDEDVMDMIRDWADADAGEHDYDLLDENGNPL